MGVHDTLLRLSAVELAQLYRQRGLSPVEVITATEGPFCGISAQS